MTSLLFAVLFAVSAAQSTCNSTATADLAACQAALSSCGATCDCHRTATICINNIGPCTEAHDANVRQIQECQTKSICASRQACGELAECRSLQADARSQVVACRIEKDEIYKDLSSLLFDCTCYDAFDRAAATPEAKMLNCQSLGIIREEQLNDTNCETGCGRTAQLALFALTDTYLQCIKEPSMQCSACRATYDMALEANACYIKGGFERHFEGLKKSDGCIQSSSPSSTTPTFTESSQVVATSTIKSLASSITLSASAVALLIVGASL